MMVLIKNKKLFIFILFTLIIFVTSFKKLVESSTTVRDPLSEDDYINMSVNNSSNETPQCLSVNCNHLVNKNLNANNNGKTYDKDGDLAAYCCKSCRDGGGAKHDDGCNQYGGSCNTNISGPPPRERALRWRLRRWRRRLLARRLRGNKNIEGMMNCDGIIDNGRNICYTLEDNEEMTEEPSLDNPESCGPYSFYQCFKDPNCANYMNNINMSSYEELEPQNNPEWQSNITNMLSFKHFNNLNNETDNDGMPGNTLDGNYCIDLCTKAKDNEDGTGGSANADLDARMNNEDNDIRNAALCEKSNAIWRAKMLCNSCLTQEDDNGYNILTNDPNYRKLSCHADAPYENTKKIQDKQSIMETDNNGDTNYLRFKLSDAGDGVFKDLELVDDDIATATNILNGTGWKADQRNKNDIEFGCRLNCAYDMLDNCFIEGPNNNEINTIKNQCRKACDKRLPAWAYYPSDIGKLDQDNDDLEVGDGWLDVTDRPQKWSDWRKIFSPGFSPPRPDDV